MLEKIVKGVLTSNIRTKCIIEVKFNFKKKILARDFIQCEEKCVNITKEQYISKNGEEIHHEN